MVIRLVKKEFKVTFAASNSISTESNHINPCMNPGVKIQNIPQKLYSIEISTIAIQNMYGNEKMPSQARSGAYKMPSLKPQKDEEAIPKDAEGIKAEEESPKLKIATSK